MILRNVPSSFSSSYFCLGIFTVSFPFFKFYFPPKPLFGLSKKSFWKGWVLGGWVLWWVEMGGYWGDKVSLNFVFGDEWLLLWVEPCLFRVGWGTC